MAKKLNVDWTEQSLKNAIEISNWIARKFSKKEVVNFEVLLKSFEEIVANFPEMYPSSKKKQPLRKAVLHKNLSVFYQIYSCKIVVIAMKDNRQEKELEI